MATRKKTKAKPLPETDNFRELSDEEIILRKMVKEMIDQELTWREQWKAPAVEKPRSKEFNLNFGPLHILVVE